MTSNRDDALPWGELLSLVLLACMFALAIWGPALIDAVRDVAGVGR